MSNQVSNINSIKSGLCPHGLPPGACPICSNMGGGSLRVGEKPQKSGEMSYHQCVMIGNLMRARELAEKRQERNLVHQTEIMKAFENNFQKLSVKLSEMLQQASGNFLLKPLILATQNIFLPIVKFVVFISKTIVSSMVNAINLIKERIVDIMDKLVAIYGEIKAFFERKISEFISRIKFKLEGLFKIFKKKNADDEDTKIDDDKKIFNFKNVLNKIITKLGRKRNDVKSSTESN